VIESEYMRAQQLVERRAIQGRTKGCVHVG
jgi:hypothetical protein